MKALFDTSVLISALVRTHASHSVSAPWLAQVQSGQLELVISAHTIAELFAALTAMPVFRVAPVSDVWSMIETSVLAHATPRTLPATAYVRLIKRLAAAGIRGGAVYDAIIAEVARREKVDLPLTLNLVHFNRVWPEGGSRIRSPHSLSPSPPT